MENPPWTCFDVIYSFFGSTRVWSAGREGSPPVRPQAGGQRGAHPLQTPTPTPTPRRSHTATGPRLPTDPTWNRRPRPTYQKQKKKKEERNQPFTHVPRNSQTCRGGQRTERCQAGGGDPGQDLPPLSGHSRASAHTHTPEVCPCSTSPRRHPRDHPRGAQLAAGEATATHRERLKGLFLLHPVP